MELQGTLDCPTSFEDFVNVDKLIPVIDAQIEENLDMSECKPMVNEHEEEGWEKSSRHCYHILLAKKHLKHCH